MSCFHNARDLSVGKMGDSGGIGSGFGRDSSFSFVVLGNIASRCNWEAAIISERDDREPKSKMGYHRISKVTNKKPLIIGVDYAANGELSTYKSWFRHNLCWW